MKFSYSVVNNILEASNKTMHSQDFAGRSCKFMQAQGVGVFYSEVLGIVYKGDYIVYCTAIMTS